MQAGEFPRVGFVGAGRLAASLAGALAKAGYSLPAVSSTRKASADGLSERLDGDVFATTDAARVAAVTDVVFLTVPDSAIRTACEAVPWEPRHTVVHCSGAMGLDVLEAASARGATTACFHPLQTFPSREPEPERFESSSCGIEGPEPAGSMLEQMAREIGATPFRLEGVDRALYHAAAVTSSNLVVALAAVAGRLWELAGLEPSGARQALSPLMLAAAKNVSERELAGALTGPVARGDVETVRRHLGVLDGEPELREIYRLLSAELLRLPLGNDEVVAERWRELLGA